MVEDKLNLYDEECITYSKNTIKGTVHLGIRDIPKILNDYKPGIRALDYGCGAGRFIKFWKKLGLQVEGADPSQEMIKIARENNPKIKFQVISPPKLPYSDHCFNIVISTFVLFEISTLEKLTYTLNEIWRILRKDGLFVAVTGSEFMYTHKWNSLFVDYPQNQNLNSGDIAKIKLTNINLEIYDYFWKDSDYRWAVGQTNFELLELQQPLGVKSDKIKWKERRNHPTLLNLYP